MEAFLSELSQVKKENTVSSYRRDLDRLGAFYQGRPLSALTCEDLKAYFFQLSQRVARSTLSRAVSAVRSYYAWLYRRGSVRQDPASSLCPGDFAQKPSPLLTSDELERLLGFSASGIRGKRDEAMIRLLCETGIRVSELVELDRGDLCPESGGIWCGRGEKRRFLPVSGSTMVCLEHCASLAALRSPGEKALFLGSSGKRITRQGFWNNLKERAQRMGIGECTPQILRQSLAKEWLAHGESRGQVRSLLGIRSDARLREYEKQRNL